MYFAVTAPYYKPLLAWPKTWTAGTKGLKKGTLLLVDAKDSAALEAYRGQLKGKIIILDQQNIYKHSFTADAKRYTDEELAAMAAAKPAAPRGAAAPKKTVEIDFSLAILRTALPTRKDGSKTFDLSRMTSTP